MDQRRNPAHCEDCYQDLLGPIRQRHPRVERFPRRPPSRISLTPSPGRCCAVNPVKTTLQDAIENMTVVDANDRAAGLPLTSQPER
jgi:hypothetical protein